MKVGFTFILMMLGRVGKTSLTLKYVRNTFNPDEVSTINASYLEKEVNVGSEKVKLAIWV